MANSIAEALGNFAQFLGQEQQRLEIEDQKDLMRASTQRITEAFSKVNPLATEEDIRQVMLDSIADASALGTLDTSMPLIQGLYSDSLNALKNYKTRKQDEALGLYAQQQGYEGPAGLTGEQKFGILQYEQGKEFTKEIEEPEATYLAKFDANLREIGRVEIGPGWQEKEEIKLRGQMRLASYQDRLQGNYVSSGALTPEGQLIVLDKRSGFSYVQSEDQSGNPINVPYTGQFVKGSPNAIRDAINTQRLYKEEKNSLYQEAGGIAVNIANSFALTDEKGAQLNSATAFNKFYAMTPGEFTKMLENVDMENRATLQEQFSKFKDLKVQYDYAQGKIQGATDIVDYNDALKIYNLDNKEFDSYYNTVVATINNPAKPKWMDFIRDKIRAGANLSKTDVASWKEEDWLKAWHNLNNKTKASIMNAIRTQNSQGNNAQ